MFGNEISDYKQLKEIRKRISNDLRLKVALKNVLQCGVKVPVVNSFRGVALVANNTTAQFVGTTHCKSPWCCPVCTARKMAKYADKIGAGLDALKDSFNAAMITFTIPHTSGFTCEQATEILYNVWKAFTMHGNKRNGTNIHDIFSNCMEALESKHRVRVTEYTYGNAGWHPHMHCLFWVPKKNWDKLLDFEEALNERWLELCERYTIKQLLIGYPETQRKTVKAKVTTRVKIMFSKLNNVSKCVYISKKDNKPIVQNSSNYLCGWGGNREVTGNFNNKATAEGHYNWQQILQLAIDTGDDKWWQLYFEYALATKKARHARVNFSVQSGLCKIISDYQNTNGYKEILKKKNMQLESRHGKYKVVCWFSAPLWQNICERDLEIPILELAILDNAYQKICDLLERRDLPKPVQKIEGGGGKLTAWIEAA